MEWYNDENDPIDVLDIINGYNWDGLVKANYNLKLTEDENKGFILCLISILLSCSNPNKKIKLTWPARVTEIADSIFEVSSIQDL